MKHEYLGMIFKLIAVALTTKDVPCVEEPQAALHVALALACWAHQ